VTRGVRQDAAGSVCRGWRAPFEHLEKDLLGRGLADVMRAPLGGQDHPVAPSLERRSERLLAAPAAIAVRRVEIGDSPVDGVAHNLDVVDRIAPEADLRDLKPRL